jgi:hypothetical protein
MEDIDSLCDTIRYHMQAMGPKDELNDASWYKDNARSIDIVLDKVDALMDLLGAQKETDLND